VLAGIAVSFLGALGLAIAVFFMPLSESGINLSMNVLQWVGIVAAGLWASRKAGFAGLLHGALAGLGLVVFLMLVGLIIMPGLPDLALVAKRGLVALAIGSVAGIIGMNLDQ
jgi:putative membrane protein (TIGR04086 family)